MTENDPVLQGQLALLRGMYEKGRLDETAYRTELQALGVDPSTIFPFTPVPPPLPELRQRLDRLDDPQIEALALDQFPDVKGKFSTGMQRDAKVNLLLDYVRRNPEAAPALIHWLDNQPVTCDPADALACYLNHVVEANRRLQLQGIRSASGLVSI
ncbi:MAG: hypothetical protein JXA93_24445, partial [Anaerolineae bacterium]|nr:hypothetical protein [Anaerolineae bacterium]